MITMNSGISRNMARADAGTEGRRMAPALLKSLTQAKWMAYRKKLCFIHSPTTGRRMPDSRSQTAHTPQIRCSTADRGLA